MPEKIKNKIKTPPKKNMPTSTVWGGIALGVVLMIVIAAAIVLSTQKTTKPAPKTGDSANGNNTTTTGGNNNNTTTGGNNNKPTGPTCGVQTKALRVYCSKPGILGNENRQLALTYLDDLNVENAGTQYWKSKWSDPPTSAQRQATANAAFAANQNVPATIKIFQQAHWDRTNPDHVDIIGFQDQALALTAKNVKLYPKNTIIRLTPRFYLFVGDAPMASFGDVLRKAVSNEGTFDAQNKLTMFGLADQKTVPSTVLDQVFDYGGAWVMGGYIFYSKGSKKSKPLTSCRNFLMDTTLLAPQFVQIAVKRQTCAPAWSFLHLGDPSKTKGGTLVSKTPQKFYQIFTDASEKNFILVAENGAILTVPLSTAASSAYFAFTWNTWLGKKLEDGITTRGAIEWTMENNHLRSRYHFKAPGQFSMNLIGKCTGMGIMVFPQSKEYARCHAAPKNGYMYLATTSKCDDNQPWLLFGGASKTKTSVDYWMPEWNDKDLAPVVVEIWRNPSMRIEVRPPATHTK